MVRQQKVSTKLLLNMLILRSDSDLDSLSYVYLYGEPVSNLLMTNENPLPSTMNQNHSFSVSMM